MIDESWREASDSLVCPPSTSAANSNVIEAVDTVTTAVSRGKVSCQGSNLGQSSLFPAPSASSATACRALEENAPEMNPHARNGSLPPSVPWSEVPQAVATGESMNPFQS